jgi:transposase
LEFLCVKCLSFVDASTFGKEGFTMPKSRPPYPPELRRRMVELVRSGRSPESLAEEYEPSGESIRNCVKQADGDSGKRPDGLTTEEKDELARLRRENRTLREERAILARAAA